MMVEKKGIDKRQITYSLICLSFITLAASAVSPVLADVKNAFPDEPASMVAMLTTLPTLLAIPATLVTGRLIGEKFSYKRAAALGIALNIIGGIMPAVTYNFVLMLFWRALFGLGTGILTPIIMPVMMASFSKEEVFKQTSKNAVATNIGAIVFQMCGGSLCARFGWRATFAIYIIMIPILIWVVVRMPELEFMQRSAAESKIHFKDLKKIYKWCFLYFIHMILFYVSVTETSGVVRESGYGSSTVTATILSIVTVGGIFGGIVFKQISGMNTYVFPAAYILLAAGYLIMATSVNVVLLGTGAIVLGIGFGIHMAAIPVFLGLDSPSHARSTAAAIANVFASLGSFISNFAVTALVRSLGFEPGRANFMLVFVVYLILASVVVICIKVRKREE